MEHSSLDVTITVVTNSQLNEQKLGLFDPKWLLHYIKLHDYNEQILMVS
jgi:hypothetical protein